MLLGQRKILFSSSVGPESGPVWYMRRCLSPERAEAPRGGWRVCQRHDSQALLGRAGHRCRGRAHGKSSRQVRDVSLPEQ